MASGRPRVAFSLKLTTNIWSSGLLNRTKVRTAVTTSESFRRMLPLMVDNKSHGNRSIFVTEQADGLPEAVFVNLKIPLARIGGEMACPVPHRGVQHHQIDVDGNAKRIGYLWLGLHGETGEQKQGR